MTRRLVLAAALVVASLTLVGSAQAAPTAAPQPTARELCRVVRHYGREHMTQLFRAQGFALLGRECFVNSPIGISPKYHLRALRKVRVHDWRGAHTYRKGQRACRTEYIEWQHDVWYTVDHTWWYGC